MVEKKALMEEKKFRYDDEDWNQKQMAFADLLNAGIGNFIGNQEYKGQKKTEQKIKETGQVQFDWLGK